MRNRIIVGVKYCFRYHARNRAALLDEAGAGAIDLQAVNPQPRRRRRERKLLSMEEVEREFPLMKYGVWMSSRQQAGLPAEGGVDGENAKQVVERAPSVRNVEGAIEIAPVSPITAKPSMEKDTTKMDTTEVTASPAAARQSSDITTASTPPIQTITSHENATDPHILSKLQTNQTTHTLDPKNPDAHHSDAEHSEDEDEDAIQAIHPDVTDHPGDSCAICIDVLEDDEDVRGLTCGHAFHASCIDPWLTSRRACCPLCKRDYWVPKPRNAAEADAPEETPEERRQRRREREERRAARDGQAVWSLRGGRFYLPGRFLGGGPVYVREGNGFRNLSPNEIRRRERAEMERLQSRREERMAASLAQRAAREQARQDRRDNGGGGGWRGLGLFGRGSGNPDPEAQARAAPQNAAEAQRMAQARGQRVGQVQMNGVVLGRLNVFGGSGGGSNATGTGQAGAAGAAAPSPGQVEAQNAQAPARRGWIFR